MTFAVVAVLVVPVTLALSRLLRGSMGGARNTLDERYASSEIDRDEYVQKRRDLGG